MSFEHASLALRTEIRDFIRLVISSRESRPEIRDFIRQAISSSASRPEIRDCFIDLVQSHGPEIKATLL